MKKIRVLLVDDHAMVREAIARALGAEDDIHVVAQAPDGRAGVAAAARLRPDVATLDVAMPSLNGLDAARRIRSVAPDTRILMLTAHEEDVFLDRALENGVDGYVSKRSPVDSLAQAIRDVAAGRRAFSPKMAARIAEKGSPRGRTAGRKSIARLSTREIEVLQLVAEGHPNKEVATRLGISIKTVEKHRQKLMDKLQLHETAGLTRYAVASGLIEVPGPFPRRPVLGARAAKGRRPEENP